MTFTDNGLSLGRKHGGSACSSVGGGEFRKTPPWSVCWSCGSDQHERVAEEQQPLGKRYSWRLPLRFPEWGFNSTDWNEK